MNSPSDFVGTSLRTQSDAKFRERPILFSAPMVRALLSGAKTQTRRLVKPQPPSVEAVYAKAGIDYSWFTHAQHHPGVFCVAGPVWAVRDLGSAVQMRCPYGVPGDRLWVRETWHPCDSGPDLYAADYASKAEAGVERWKPSIFMPRATSRIVLEVTGVRVERLHDISEADAAAEGVDPEEWWTVWDPETKAAVDVNVAPTTRTILNHERQTARAAYKRLWGVINSASAWALNPWVWVVEFKRVKP